MSSSTPPKIRKCSKVYCYQVATLACEICTDEDPRSERNTWYCSEICQDSDKETHSARCKSALEYSGFCCGALLLKTTAFNVLDSKWPKSRVVVRVEHKKDGTVFAHYEFPDIDGNPFDTIAGLSKGPSTPMSSEERESVLAHSSCRFVPALLHEVMIYVFSSVASKISEVAFKQRHLLTVKAVRVGDGKMIHGDPYEPQHEVTKVRLNNGVKCAFDPTAGQYKHNRLVDDWSYYKDEFAEIIIKKTPISDQRVSKSVLIDGPANETRISRLLPLVHLKLISDKLIHWYKEWEVDKNLLIERLIRLRPLKDRDQKREQFSASISQKLQNYMDQIIVQEATDLWSELKGDPELVRAWLAKGLR